MSGAYLALKRFAPKMLLLAGVLVLAFAAIRPAQAQYTQSVPYTFTGGGDGAAPAAGLISDSKGNLYGTAAYGGDTSGSSCPGQNPPTGCGVIFELSPPSVGGGPWTETVLYTFTGGSDGGVPYAGLTFDSKGNLYGTTSHGGDTSGSNCSGIGGCGVVFELSPPSVGGGPWTETVLCTFTGGSDGGVPYAGLIFDAGGNLYGTTSGGGSSTYGVVFELSPPSGGSPWNETVLYAFTGVDDGESPLASLIFDSKGNLYGIAFGGKAGYGVAFELTPPSGGSGPWNEAVLYTFHSRSDGAYPYAGLIFDSKGNLYGTTSNGGDTSGSNCKATRGCGVVFELSPPTGGSGMWTETTPYSFTGGSDGGYPDAGLIFDSKGNLYGTTGQGGNLSGSNCSGSSGCGVVFELIPPTGGTGSWTESVLYTFNGGGDGADPSAGLIFDATGNFYGTAYSGGDMSGSNCSGTGGCGVVFELSPRQAPAVALSPISLNFGNQVLNTTSAVRKVTATNTGSVTLNISSITVSASFGISANTCGAQLAEGKSCKVSVTFAPPKLGEITGTLSFTDDALNSPQTVPLLGTGIDPATLTPSSAVYGKQKMGTSSMPKTFTLANNQSVALTSIAISTTGDFAVSATTCGTSLAAKQKCTTSVTFTPTQTGTRIGQLTVSDSANNSPQTASLRGTGD